MGMRKELGKRDIKLPWCDLDADGCKRREEEKKTHGTMM